MLDPGEEIDPPLSPFSTLTVDPTTCRFDLSSVAQLYCNGICTYDGGPGCDQADADALCRLRLDDEFATAASWTSATAQDYAGFSCVGYGTAFVEVADRVPGIDVVPHYQDDSLFENHGNGSIILDPVCLPCSVFDGDGDGFSPCAGDCDDSDPGLHPDAYDICDDGIDQDCDLADAVCVTSCGNGVLDPGEELDPPLSPVPSAPVDPTTCRFDFSAVTQLYCNGSCTWAGSYSCDDADADALCRLQLDDVDAFALSWTPSTAQSFGGFTCEGIGTALPQVAPRAPGIGVVPHYQEGSILANHGAGDIVLDPDCSLPVCGDGVLSGDEEIDPPISPLPGISVDPATCRFDFSAVTQLYCNGTCTYDASNGCQQADADIACQLITGNPASTATAYTATTAQPIGGFSCPGIGTAVPEIVPRAAAMVVTPWYQPTDILGNHGAGDIILDPVCTDP